MRSGGRGVELLWPGKYDEAGGRVPLLPPAGPAPRLRELAGEGPAGNQLIEGDNLAVMAGLLGELAGKIDLVYLDPPFATGGRFSATTAVGEATTGAVELAAYDDGAGLGEFLASMAPRLALVRELLAPAGLLLVHLDDNASHAVKLLLDEIFGPACFRGEIVWGLGTGAKSRRFFSIQHNLILAYSRGSSWYFDPDSPLVREPFAPGSLSSHFRNVDAQGRRFRRRVVNGKEYIYHADQGRLMGSVWSDIPSMIAGSPIMAESTGYPTQKPERLLERLLASCSPPGGLVADFFCGSGTTLVAAEKLGRRWVGCDAGRLAVHTARKRLLGLRVEEGGSPRAARAFSIASHQEAPPLARLDIELRPAAGGAWQAALVGFEPPGGGLPARAKEALRSWEDQVDAWAIDWDLQGTFVNRWHAHRTRRQRSLPLVSPPFRPGPGGVCVRAFDMLGHEGSWVGRPPSA